MHFFRTTLTTYEVSIRVSGWSETTYEKRLVETLNEAKLENLKKEMQRLRMNVQIISDFKEEKVMEERKRHKFLQFL